MAEAEVLVIFVGFNLLGATRLSAKNNYFCGIFTHEGGNLFLTLPPWTSISVEEEALLFSSAALILTSPNLLLFRVKP